MATALSAVSFTGHLGSIPSQGADKSHLNNNNMKNENCLFCKIVAGEIPSVKIWEDEKVLAFLDIHPINPGHILVIPKKHEPDFYNLDGTSYLTLMSAVKHI